MSGHGVNQKVLAPPRELRRTVTVYERMEAARARRAALLGPSNPANLPRQARAEPEAPPAPVEPVVQPEETLPATDRRVVPWLVRGLVILLAVLIAIALLTASPRVISLPQPDFAPPLPALAAQGLGGPLLVTIPASAPPPGTGAAPAPLRPFREDVAYVLVSRAPLERGPAVFEAIDTLAPPPVRPSGLFTSASG